LDYKRSGGQQEQPSSRKASSTQGLNSTQQYNNTLSMDVGYYALVT
jgi:hypothetical protein